MVAYTENKQEEVVLQLFGVTNVRHKYACPNLTTFTKKEKQNKAHLRHCTLLRWKVKFNI